MKPFKYILIVFISLFFASCSQITTFNISEKNNHLNLVKDKNNFIKVDFTNPIYKYNVHSCIDNAYVINDNHSLYGQLFVEDIELNDSCIWRGSVSSRFEHNLMFSLKLTSIKIVEEFEIGNYNFKTYFMDENFYLSLIHIFGTARDTIILDNDGKLYTKLLKLFKSNYVNDYISKKRYNKKYNNSLSGDVIFYNYFGRKNDI